VYDPLINGSRFTFGVTGKVYKNGIVMYDRDTESLWSQILQHAITGSMTGTRLTMLPAQHTTWKEWRGEHPETLVLSPDTGFKRDYGRNPYQEYYERGEPFSGTRERARELDPSLRPMERVFGIQVEGIKKAYPFSRLKKLRGKFEDMIAGQKIVIHFQAKSESAYATTVSGSQIPAIAAFWFAWVDFYPDTQVFKTDPSAR
jgi:hypothetical protein